MADKKAILEAVQPSLVKEECLNYFSESENEDDGDRYYPFSQMNLGDNLEELQLMASCSNCSKEFRSMKGGSKAATVKCPDCVYQDILSNTKLDADITIDDNRFSCFKCDLEFYSELELSIHSKIHANGKFKCLQCNRTCKTSYALNKHIETHIQTTCKICNYECSKAQMDAHISKVHSYRPYQCTECDYSTQKKHKLIQHLGKHSQGRPYVCDICHLSFRRKFHLQSHIGIHSGDKPYQCQICPYKTRRKSDLKKHLPIHTNERIFSCDKCGFQCKTKQCMDNHHKKLHPSHIDPSQPDAPIDRFIFSGELLLCTQCEFKCKNHKSLILHLQKHEKPAYCEYCDCEFNNVMQLRYHKRVHERKYIKCSQCPFIFESKGDLKKHIEEHHDSVLFSCLECNFVSSDRISLLKHSWEHFDDT